MPNTHSLIVSFLENTVRSPAIVQQARQIAIAEFDNEPVQGKRQTADADRMSDTQLFLAYANHFGKEPLLSVFDNCQTRQLTAA